MALRPKPSLVSSFTVSGYEAALRNWPAGVGIELYAYMRADTDDRGALAYLSRMYRDEGARRAAVKRFVHARRRHGCDEPLVALASFLPEISRFGPADDHYDMAVDAIACLLMLAREFRQELKEEGSSPRVVEVVGGSVVEGIWRGKPDESQGTEYPFVALMVSPEEAAERLVDTLAESCRRAGLTRRDGISLALELEPGPLVVLNDLEALDRCLKLLERKGLPGLIGFNLDIAHWHLAGIAPEDIADRCPGLCGQIVHAHISDHAKGHFGDAVIGSLGFEIEGAGPAAGGGRSDDRLSVFRRWLDFLSDCWSADRRRGRPQPSGYVSVEMEACEDIVSVNQSVSVLQKLLADIGK